jgi:redox-sensing transcriptional repressor
MRTPLAGVGGLFYSVPGAPAAAAVCRATSLRSTAASLIGMSSSKSSTPRTDPVSVPAAVVNRLSLYLRELQHLVAEGIQTTSSSQLGERLGFSDAQVRKDLAHFGNFGHPGIGYRCDELIGEIRRILGTDRRWSVALVGVGNLGRALLGYRRFEPQGFKLVAAFDADPAKVGTRVEGVEILAMDQLPQIVSARRIDLGLVAVPAAHAQAAADLLVAAGVGGIVNFAPVTLALPAGVCQLGVDLARELEQVAFAVANRLRSELE